VFYFLLVDAKNIFALAAIEKAQKINKPDFVCIRKSLEFFLMLRKFCVLRRSRHDEKTTFANS